MCRGGRDPGAPQGDLAGPPSATGDAVAAATEAARRAYLEAVLAGGFLAADQARSQDTAAGQGREGGREQGGGEGHVLWFPRNVMTTCVGYKA